MSIADGNSNKGQTAPAFLEKLYEIMSDDSNNAYIAWQEDGSSFLIKKVPELQEIVLPKYFKHNNLQSFVRQLNMYNFTKTCHDPNFREFMNPHFQRGNKQLLHLIKRKTQSNFRESFGSSTYAGSSSARVSGGAKSSPQLMDLDNDEGGGICDEGSSMPASRASSRKKTSSCKAAISSSSSRKLPSYSEQVNVNENMKHNILDNSSTSEYKFEAMYPTRESSDVSSLLVTTDDLQWRVRQLETTNTLLMERFTGLAKKHDELCNILHKYLISEQPSNRKTCGTSSTSCWNVDEILESRLNWGESTRRRACSDMSSGACESSTNNGASSGNISADDHIGSLESTSSRFPDTDSDHASESDGILELRKTGSRERRPEEYVKAESDGTVGESVVSSRDYGGSITVADICDSPTYHAANILVRGISSNDGPARDDGLSNFVDAISSIWSSNSCIGLHKHSQLNNSQCEHLIQIPLADHGIGVGGGYVNLAGQPITKQVSMPASFDQKVGKKRIKTLHVPSYLN